MFFFHVSLMVKLTLYVSSHLVQGLCHVAMAIIAREAIHPLLVDSRRSAQRSIPWNRCCGIGCWICRRP